MAKYVSPKGHDIVGSYEIVFAVASIEGIQADGTPEYDGSGSDVDWDSQVQVKRGGEYVFVCENGSLWKFSELTKVEDSEEH